MKSGGHMREEKEGVKHYYDTFGWQKTSEGIYKDTATWFDLSRTTSWYQHQCLMRTKRYLKPSGMYFLNAGSGAIQHPEHIEYTSGYRWHVCLDLSIVGLVEARSKLGGRGLYVVGDATKLPFKDGAFDSAISSEVLFHIPADQQQVAVRELHRVLRRGGNAVIIYMWPGCLLSALADNVGNFRRKARKILRRLPLKSPGRLNTSRAPKPSNKPPIHPPLYCHAYDYSWFQRTLPREWKVMLRPFRTIDEGFMATMIPHNWIGELLLKLVFWAERIFPSVFARIGRYPMIIINKDLSTFGPGSDSLRADT